MDPWESDSSIKMIVIVKLQSVQIGSYLTTDIQLPGWRNDGFFKCVCR